mgnify:FL=1
MASRLHRAAGMSRSLVVLCVLALAACDKKEPPPAPAAFEASELAALKSLPKGADPASANPDRVALGKMLYFEARLSKNHDVSCNSCHHLDAFGVDGAPTSEGHRKQHGNRNAPTVLNAAVAFRQFWDGRAADVEEQATGPIVNPVEMASSEPRVVATLASMPEYVSAFGRAFPGESAPITLKNVGIAIGAFERELVVAAPIDRWLDGDRSARGREQRAGAAAFAHAGCPSCHMGSGIGGAIYQKAGFVKPWPNQKDQGRFDLTKQESDRMMFKVPSLRNVTKTGPYFHDGSVASLEEAVRMMGRYQLGKELSDADVKSIVVFLDALSAAPPAELVAPPALPKSTDATPKPDPD